MFNEANDAHGAAPETAENVNGGNGDETFARNDNFLKSCAATILERYSKAKASTRSSLEDLRVVGEMLNDAKETLKDVKGGFGKWCDEAGFPFDKTWRARLMKLAANWEAIIAAVEALPEDKQKWLVDGVLAIWTAAEKAKQAPQGEGGAGGSEGEGEGGEAKPQKAKRETEAEKLRRLLAEALAEVERLKAENESLKGNGGQRSDNAKGREKADKARPEGSDKGTVHVDPVTATRARKVWMLYTKGATEGEKEAAKSRLDEMADKFGMSFADFVKACNLK